jgi:hypothetical protein
MDEYQRTISELEDFVFELKRLTASNESRFQFYLSKEDLAFIHKAHAELDRITLDLIDREIYAESNAENERDEIRAFYQSVLPRVSR